MEMLISSFQTVLALVAIALSSVLASLVLLLLFFSKRRDKRHISGFSELQKDQGILAESFIALEARIAKVEEAAQRVNERQDQLELRETISQTYDPAIKMAHKGADVEELVSTCGLARGEAELILLLHRSKTGSAALPISANE